MKLILSENKKYLKITEATENEYSQLRLTFTKRINGWRFHPLVKKGLWDGYITYVKNNLVPSGLWKEVIDRMKDYSIDVHVDGITKLFNYEIKFDEFNDWVDDFFKGFEKTPRDYQVTTAYKILVMKRCMAELATSAGKSLIIFMVLAYLFEKGLIKKVLMIVPNVSLVMQGADDFDDYNHQSRVNMKIQQIYAGSKIKKDSNIVIGTFQSLVKKKKEYYKDFDLVVVDELHRGNSNSIRSIMDKTWHCDYRFGVSGTIPAGDTVEGLNLMSSTGPLVTNIKADFLMDKGYITRCEVKMIAMDYATKDEKQAFYDLHRVQTEKTKLFSLEQKFVIHSEKRLKFVISIINKTKANSMILFHKIEYGTAMYKALKQMREQEVFYVDGSVSGELRDNYKREMETGEGKLLVASFGTFSTGINITNIHNIFLTESFKSEVIIRQSIGRGLRKHKTKGVLTIFDFVDDFRVVSSNGRKWSNYVYKHAIERQKIYDTQGFPYEVRNVKF